MVVQEGIDLGDDLGWCLRELPCRQGARQGDASGSPTAETHAGCDDVTLGQRDILDEQTHHALAFPLRRLRVIPQSWKIGGEGKDLPSLYFVEPLVIRPAPPLKFFLGLMEPTELLVPLSLQNVGDETVSWVDLHVASPSKLCLMTSSFYRLAPQCIGLVYTRIELSLHFQCNLQRHGRDHLQEKFADTLVDARSRNGLALGGRVVDAFPLANILWQAL